MNLYNFTLDRDKLLHQIKARNFTWFLSIACVSCYGPEKVSVKDAGMASGLPSREENMQTNLPIFETFVRGNHYTGGSGGMEGAGEGGPGALGAGPWPRPPDTPSPQMQMCSSPIYKQHSPASTSPAPPRITWSCQSHVGWSLGPPAPVRGAESGRLLPGSLFFLSSPPPGEAWSCPESGLVWDDYIWFLFLFFRIAILPVPSCLPPLNMYSIYTETAINLYIVFGSNSMRR